MPVYPRTSQFGIATAWTTALRPANAPHGFIGLNETTGEIEVYNAITDQWSTTTDVSAIYPA